VEFAGGGRILVGRGRGAQEFCRFPPQRNLGAGGPGLFQKGVPFMPKTGAASPFSSRGTIYRFFFSAESQIGGEPFGGGRQKQRWLGQRTKKKKQGGGAGFDIFLKKL